jgi:hypothetical protein
MSFQLQLDPSKKAYRAAIILNNKGVSMLEKGLFERAHQTLMDATTALKGVFRASPPETDLDRLLQCAFKRASDPQQKPVSVDCVNAMLFDLSMPPDIALIESISPVDSEVITPITIDVIDSDVGSASLATELSVIILNLGITSFLLGRSDSKEGKRTRHYFSQAYRFLTLALEFCTRNRMDEAEETHVCRLFVAFHAIRSLLQVCRVGEDIVSDDGERFASMYQEMRSQICEWQKDSPFLKLLSQGKYAAAA